MEAVCFYEIMVLNYKARRCHTPENLDVVTGIAHQSEWAVESGRAEVKSGSKSK
jgi:hypothetical protein